VLNQTWRDWLRLVGAAGITGLAGCGSSEEALPGGKATPTETLTPVAIPGDEPSTDVTVEWAFETGARVPSSPVVVDDTVYAGSNDGNVYAVSE
jgi:hypothetical protein